MSSRFLSNTGMRVWPASITSAMHLSHGSVDVQHVHVGAGRHDLRHVGVAQFDDAFDHLAGLVFEQAFAMALGDDRADFFLDGFFVGKLLVAAGEAVEQRVEQASARQPAAQPTRSSALPEGPGEVQEFLGEQSVAAQESRWWRSIKTRPKPIAVATTASQVFDMLPANAR